MIRNRQRAEFQRGSVGAEVIQFVELAEQDRQLAASLPAFEERDGIKLRVIRSNGDVGIVHLPTRVARVIGALLNGLEREKRVVLMSEGRADLTSCKS